MKTTRIHDLHLLTLAATLIGATAITGCRGGEAGAGIADAGNDDDDDDDESGDGMDGTMDADDDDDDDDNDFEPMLLSCPEPGSLPFETESTGFMDTDAEMIAGSNPRFKDEASDIIGNPGGVSAPTTLPVDGSPGSGAFEFDGKKARAPIDSGLVSEGLPNEFVSMWTWNGTEWGQLAREQLNSGGAYSISGLEAPGNNFQPIYSILEADGSCTEHFVFMLDQGAPIIVTDIDGTMTLSDDELFSQISDGNYDPLENPGSATMMNLWADKGYIIVYLTARPHAFRAETRSWLTGHGFPVGPVISANSLVVDESARQYKRAWVNRLTQDFGWRIAAAYGNATSDIDAYEDGGIAKDVTFIIGEHAGAGDTQAVEANDYTQHIADFVEPHPDAADF